MAFSAALVLAGVFLIAPMFAGQAGRSPHVLGWLVATLNFTVAVILGLSGIKKSFKTCMIMVLGASGVRMLLMVLAIVGIMVYKREWLTAFAVSLLGCFMVYLFIEVALLYKKGLSLSGDRS